MILCRIILILKQLALISGKNPDHLLLRCIKSRSRQSLLIWGKMGSNEPSFCNQFDWAIKMQLWKRWLPLSCFYHFILPSTTSKFLIVGIGAEFLPTDFFLPLGFLNVGEKLTPKYKMSRHSWQVVKKIIRRKKDRYIHSLIITVTAMLRIFPMLQVRLPPSTCQFMKIQI